MAEDDPIAGTASDGLATTLAGADPLAGQRLAQRYDLEALLGVGGMGSVYRARDIELDERVALKMLRKDLVDAPGILARFRQEVKLARRVTHRNVARTFDIGEHAGEKFLTMELVEGESLAEHLVQRGRLPLARAVAIAIEIALGLAAAHAAGVVHRDLKPDNVLLARDGRVVLTDFGIARAAIDAQGGLATLGFPVGTPAYMAPEQVEAAPVDRRADIYALGEILYEMLTGERAWRGDAMMQVATARLLAPPPDPRSRRPDLPPALAELAIKCMARDPADRYATADQVARELGSIAVPQGPMSAPPRPPAVLAAEATPPGVKAVAVLPFRNSGPPEDEYLADGLTEDLIDDLSMIRGVRVRALGAVLPLKGKSGDPRDLGRELGVQVVVDGTIRRVGGVLRITARLGSVADGFQLWAKRFDRPAADILEVADEIAAAISRALTVERGAAPRTTTDDPIALDLYLRARHQFHRFGRDATRRSIDLFAQALERAPDDPVILSGYAMARVSEFTYNPDAAESADAARAAANRAVQIAPGLPEPHVALAAVELALGDGEASARHVRRALEVGTSAPDAHELCGRLFIEVGRVDAGVRALETALALEPRFQGARCEVARVHELLGDPDRADELVRTPPGDPDLVIQYWLGRARLLLYRRDAEQARSLLERSGADAPPPPGRLLLQLLATGVAEEAAFHDLKSRMQRDRSARRATAFFGVLQAEVMAFLGDTEAAFAAIADVAGAGGFDVFWMDRCPLLDALRADPRFAILRARIDERARLVRRALGVDP